jgi:hypothetical protein
MVMAPTRIPGSPLPTAKVGRYKYARAPRLVKILDIASCLGPQTGSVRAVTRDRQSPADRKDLPVTEAPPLEGKKKKEKKKICGNTNSIANHGEAAQAVAEGPGP